MSHTATPIKTGDVTQISDVTGGSSEPSVATDGHTNTTFTAHWNPGPDRALICVQDTDLCSEVLPAHS